MVCNWNEHEQLVSLYRISLWCCMEGGSKLEVMGAWRDVGTIIARLRRETEGEFFVEVTCCLLQCVVVARSVHTAAEQGAIYDKTE